MKKFIALALGIIMTLSLAACGNNTQVTETQAAQASGTEETAAETAGESAASAPETVTIKSLNGESAEVDLEVPYDARRIAILDMASLDILDNLGLGDRVVGSAQTSLDYLQSYVTDENVANLGTIKEADLEAVMACEPDVIFIGGRLSASYDALSEIAPVVYLSTDTELGVVESVRKNAQTIASMFGLESQVDALMRTLTAALMPWPLLLKARQPLWVCVPAEALMSLATTDAAPSSDGRSVLKTLVWTRM